MTPVIKSKSSIIDQMQERPAPYYDHFLHLQGYKPHEILWAEDSPKDRAILEQHRRRHYQEKDIEIQMK